MKFPKLYARSSTGKIKEWEIFVVDKETFAEIHTKHGYEGGQIQENIRRVTKGKNIGRSNSTTPYTQAVAEAQSKWQQKCDKKYVEDISEEPNILLPMLAHKYTERSHDIEFPAYTQPKLNGVRCLAEREDNTFIFHTRTGKKYTTLGHLIPTLLKHSKPGDVFDGEIFHPHWTFQTIISAVKRQQDISPSLQYWIYDIVQEIPFKDRLSILQSKDLNTDVTCLVNTELIHNDSEVYEKHQTYIQQGFEGIIIRNGKGIYRKDYRSADLQKYKDFVDEEFKIVGGKEGSGLAEGTVIWTCVNEDGQTFEVKPKGTVEQRKYHWDHLNDYIGKLLTVRYQYRSDKNVPIFPVGLVIRDYE